MRNSSYDRPQRWTRALLPRFPKGRVDVGGSPTVLGEGDGIVWDALPTRHLRVQEMVPGSPEAEAPPIWVTPEADRRLRDTVGRVPAESGGPLCGDRRRGIVEIFVPDESAGVSRSTYSPDTVWLNQMLKTELHRQGKFLKGFAHSHPPGGLYPSQGDRRYAGDLLAAIPGLDRLLLPILESEANTGRTRLEAFVASRSAEGLPVIRSASWRVLEGEPRRRANDHEVFSRVPEAYDLEAMTTARGVIVGVGGAATFAEHLVRCGVGEIVLIDPDRVEAVNVPTQQVYLSDVGRTKVEAIADRLVDISPTVAVMTVPARLQELDRTTLRWLLHRPLRHDEPYFPRATLLCGFTDSFWAQAETARIALEEGVPFLAAQVYERGRAAEIVFVAPGRTEACHRCILGARYEAHLHGFVNDVGTAASPLYATERLNATKALVAVAMLHALHPDADPSHPAVDFYSSLFDRIKTQNLLRIRLAPELPASLGGEAFEKAFGKRSRHPSVVCDETIWWPMSAKPGCPDCGGTGDLTGLVGDVIPRIQPPTVGNREAA